MRRRHSIFLSAIIMLSLSGLVSCKKKAGFVPDNTTLVAFSRHTFRGIAKEISPQKIDLSEYGIDVGIPSLSYGEDATPRGMAIAEDYASAGLVEAARMAVAALGEGKHFDGHWDEIRADLSTERTFWTALHLRNGLVAQNHRTHVEIPVTGCPTKPGKGVDAVSIDKAVKECVPETLQQNLIAASPDLKKFQSLSQIFLNEVRASIGLNDPVTLPDAKAYDKIAELASIIEMSSELAPPLGQIFKDSPKGPLLEHGRASLSKGVESLGMRFFVNTPTPLADAISVYPLRYMVTRPRGSHTIVLSHDDFISALLHALGLIASDGDPDDLAIYPVETFLFAFGENRVTVVRMRIQSRDPDGAISGPYASKILWQGTRAQWDEKVAATAARAQGWDLGENGNACLKAIPICEAQKIDVTY